ncbi:MAG: ankyrin repeat domain-containing protein [Verrucomicrobiales bacterium]
MRRAGLVLLAAITPFACKVYAGELADATERGEWDQISRLIAAGEAPDAPQIDGMTALHWAVFHDNPRATKALIEAGAEPGWANDYGVTPLSLACQNGNATIVRQLLAHGADPNTELEGGETALMTAARTGDADCVRSLLAGGAEIDVRERRGQTAIMWAAADGHNEVVEALLEAGAEFRKPLKSGFTPLLFAVRQGHIDVVRSLIEAGAEVNAAAEPDRPRGRSMRSGTSPLMLAVENGHFELAIELVDAGADPNDQRSRFTPLHALTWVRKSVRGDGHDGIPTPRGSGDLGSLGFARELIARGADVNARLKNGSGGAARVHKKGATPFLMASETCDIPLMKLLIELGADPEIPNTQGCMPILAAAGVGVFAPGEEAGLLDDALEAVVYLLEIGADINAVDKSGETVMHGAAYKCAPEMIRLLDQRGAKIEVWNTKNKSGWTPLMIAQGFRPGNFRPIAEVTEAISVVMESHGLTPPPPPERGKKKQAY